MTKQWIKYEKDELEKLILKLAKAGNTNTMIGTILRDQYGIPRARELNLKIKKVVESQEKPVVPEDMFNLMKKAVNLHRHMAENKGDASTKHGLEYVESKIRRLGKYYVKKKTLPKGWKYNIEEVKLLVK
ncbi:MAG: 30S ribosomal protein S15 [Candidatus Aenigmarchaeota archaeon]|nr:30S ribosomal protein S15 [Candidatus Aenigmarchaeota archaeon]